MTELDATVLADTVSVVVKYERDHARAVAALPTLIDPNAIVPAKHHDHDHHSHSHGGHSHSHDDGGAPHVHPEDVGAVRRAAMDKPGRHGPGHYGTPPYAAEQDEPEPAPAVVIAPDRGRRSFAASLGRRRAI